MDSHFNLKPNSELSNSQIREIISRLINEKFISIHHVHYYPDFSGAKVVLEDLDQIESRLEVDPETSFSLVLGSDYSEYKLYTVSQSEIYDALMESLGHGSDNSFWLNKYGFFFTIEGYPTYNVIELATKKEQFSKIITIIEEVANSGVMLEQVG